MIDYDQLMVLRAQIQEQGEENSFLKNRVLSLSVAVQKLSQQLGDARLLAGLDPVTGEPLSLPELPEFKDPE